MTNGIKVRHHSIRASIEALWMEYLYGDGWRLVEIVMGTYAALRGIGILFFDGMNAPYYASFPLVEMPFLWGITAIAIGLGRIAGTVINGRWSRSPRLRWTAGFASVVYNGMHVLIFAGLGLSIITIIYAFWTVLEAAGVIRSSIDIKRKRDDPCRNG